MEEFEQILFQVREMLGYDHRKLRDELGVAGLPVREVYPGNNCFVFEFFRALNEEEKMTLAEVIYKHKPLTDADRAFMALGAGGRIN